MTDTDSPTRNRRRTVEGVVSSDARVQTIAVEAHRLVRYPKYGKYVKRTSRYHAHDEKDEARVGDIVEIMETRPISKQKRWRLVRVIKRAAGRGDV